MLSGFTNSNWAAKTMSEVVWPARMLFRHEDVATEPTPQICGNQVVLKLARNLVFYKHTILRYIATSLDIL